MSDQISNSTSIDVNETNLRTSYAPSIDTSDLPINDKKRQYEEIIDSDEENELLSPPPKRRKLNQEDEINEKNEKDDEDNKETESDDKEVHDEDNKEIDCDDEDDDDMVLSQENVNDVNNEITLKDLIQKYSYKQHISIKKFQELPPSQQKLGYKWFFLAKVIFKLNAQSNGAPDSCIIDDNSAKMVVKSFDKNVISRLQLNKVYWISDFSGYKTDKLKRIQYIRYPTFGYLNITAATSLFMITKNGWHSDFNEDVFNKHPVIDQSAVIVKKNNIQKVVKRKIGYFTDKKPNDINSGYVIKGSSIVQTGRNITGIISKVTSKFDKRNNLYILLKIHDESGSFLINIFNVFESDVTKFEHLSKTKGVIALINFGMKISNDTKYFDIKKGYYLLDVEHDQKELLQELEFNDDNLPLIVNSSCREVKETFAYKKNDQIEYFIVKAKITKVGLGYDEVPFKFFIKQAGQYGEFNKETKKVFFNGNDLAISSQHIIIKSAIKLTIFDGDFHVSRLGINSKVFQQIFVDFETNDMAKLYNEWVKDSDKFETKLEDVEQKEYIFKIYINSFRGKYYKRICEAKLQSI